MVAVHLLTQRTGDTMQFLGHSASQVPTDSGVKRLDVQVLRGVAVLAVIFFHAGAPLPGGFAGVDVFFVVSGFVIGAMLLREHRLTGRIALRVFFSRRVRRLIPAVALMVAVVSLFSLLIYPTFEVFEPAFRTGIAGLLFVANVAIDRQSWDYFAPLTSWNPFLHLWSLGVEEQFYLFLPFVLALLLPRSRRLLVISLVGLAVLSFALSWFGSSDFKLELPFGQSFIGFYSPITRVWEFMVGVLLALLPTVIIEASKAKMLAAFAGFGLLVSFILLEPGIEDRTLPLLLPVTMTATLIFAGTSLAATFWNQSVALRVLAKVGDWSYSLYLWHWPVMVLAAYIAPNVPEAKFLSLAISVPLALASYQYVETPLRLGRVCSPFFSTVVASAMGVLSSITLVCVALLSTHLVEPWMTARATNAGQLDNPLSSAIDRGATDCSDYSDCTQTADRPGPGVMILGSSHGADLFLGISEKSPGPVKQLDDSDTGYLDVDSDLHKQIVADSSVDVVVIAHYLGHPSRNVHWDSLRDAVVSFVSSGKSVLIVDDVPNINYDPVRCAYGLPILPSAKVCETPSADSDQVRARYLPEIQQLDRDFPEVSLVEAYEAFCSEGVCTVGGSGEVWFRDSNHLTTEGSRKAVNALVFRSS
ncbi:acyltransferase [Pontimonas sp.]|nr:acyltransferase family protein [Pontimonas sp.]MDA8862977.1 acyltransferase [Pontimonas sp.]